MNAIQNNCLVNGHNSISADTYTVLPSSEQCENKIKFSEKLKVLLENRGNEKVEYDDPYAFHDVESNIVNSRVKTNFFHKNPAKFFNSRPLDISKSRIPAQLPVTLLPGKPQSFAKLIQETKTANIDNLRNGNALKRAKSTNVRSLSLDSEISIDNHKKSLLEASLLGIKGYNQRKESIDNKHKYNATKPLHAATPTLSTPAIAKIDKTEQSRHANLERIWTVRNQIVSLNNDYRSSVIPFLGCYEEDNEMNTSCLQSQWLSFHPDTQSDSWRKKRDVKISQLKLELRHKLKQLHHNIKDKYRDKMTSVLIESAKRQPNLTAALIKLTTKGKKWSRCHIPPTNNKRCSYADTTSGLQCDYLTMPLSNYCQQHIVCCKEQLLFTTCTAIRENNVPCRAPVLDHIVNNPFCLEHRRQRLLSQKPKTLAIKSLTIGKLAPARKRSRSTTGRSRKRKKTIKEKKEANIPIHVNGMHKGPFISKEGSLPYINGSLANFNAQVIVKNEIDESQEVEVGEEVLAMAADLPLETVVQATRLLEEHDFTNVLNHIPVDAFNDLFKEDKGEYEPTPQETEELERALEAVDKDVKSLEKLSQTQGILETLLDDHTLVQTLAQLPQVQPVFYQNGFSIDTTQAIEHFIPADILQS